MSFSFISVWGQAPFAPFSAASLGMLFWIIIILMIYGMRIYTNSGPTIRFILPRNERREVSWGVLDAVFALLMFTVFPSFLISIALHLFVPELLTTENNQQVAVLTNSDKTNSNKTNSNKTNSDKMNSDKTDSAKESSFESDAKRQEQEELKTAHPLSALLIQSKGTPRYFMIVCLAFFAGVIAAPISEEFVFRAVFQGALEKVATRSLPGTDGTPPPRCYGYLRGKCFAILVPALLFAAVHYREVNPATNPLLLMVSFFIAPFVLALTVGLIALVFRGLYGAGLEDYGIIFRGMGKDILRGVLAFFLILPILIPMLSLLHLWFPNLVTDPIPIFLLALGLGILYWRTHRLAAVIAMHASLNLYSFILLLLHNGDFF